MSTYAIILSQDVDTNSAWKRLEKEWPTSHFKANDRLAFISLNEVLTTASIAEKIGMNSDDRVKGIVLQVGNYYGYESPEIWEWLGINK